MALPYSYVTLRREIERTAASYESLVELGELDEREDARSRTPQQAAPAGPTRRRRLFVFLASRAMGRA